MSAREELIARLEKATAPDRELDEAIHALQPEPKVIVPPQYCRSIDAALTLLRDGDVYVLKNMNNGERVHFAHIGFCKGPFDSFHTFVEARGATAAIALVTAILKARP